ncbi:hypothetical protein E2562_033575, partial [Oryza meyeriana var. granulata]
MAASWGAEDGGMRWGDGDDHTHEARAQEREPSEARGSAGSTASATTWAPWLARSGVGDGPEGPPVGERQRTSQLADVERRLGRWVGELGYCGMREDRPTDGRTGAGRLARLGRCVGLAVWAVKEKGRRG